MGFFTFILRGLHSDLLTSPYHKDGTLFIRLYKAFCITNKTEILLLKYAGYYPEAGLDDLFLNGVGF